MKKQSGWKTKIEDKSLRIKNRIETLERYNEKNKAVKITLKNEDYEKLKQIATKENETISKYCKVVLLDSIGKFQRSKADWSMISELNKIGSNINQVQKHIAIHSTFNLSIILEFNEQLEKIYNKLIDIHEIL